jgi:hypothetical protein
MRKVNVIEFVSLGKASLSSITSVQAQSQPEVYKHSRRVGHLTAGLGVRGGPDRDSGQQRRETRDHATQAVGRASEVRLFETAARD